MRDSIPMPAMPLYEYKCDDCGGEFEILLRGSDVPRCTTCQGANLHRLISLFGVSSPERSQATLVAARKKYQQGRNRQEQARHETQEIVEHMRDDYGVDITKTAPVKPST